MKTKKNSEKNFVSEKNQKSKNYTENQQKSNACKQPEVVNPPAWKLVSGSNKKQKEDYFHEQKNPHCQEYAIPLRNRFNPLFVGEKPEVVTRSLPNSVPIKNPENLRLNAKQQINDSQSFKGTPVSRPGTSPKVVPGHRPYSKAHIKNLTISTDSMCRSIRVRDFNDKIRNAGIKDLSCSIHKFPGASASEISHYSKKNIEDDEADAFLVVAGTNSLRGKNSMDGPSDKDIACELINMGQNARAQGVRTILISGIISRRGMHYQKRILNINRMVYELCSELDFIFIDNSNIFIQHLDEKDGLHLNYLGTDILKQNILRALR